MQCCKGQKVYSSFVVSWIVCWGWDSVVEDCYKREACKGTLPSDWERSCMQWHTFAFKAGVINFKVMCSCNLMCILFLITPLPVRMVFGFYEICKTYTIKCCLNVRCYFRILILISVSLHYLSQFTKHFGEERTKVVNFYFIVWNDT